MRILPGLFAEGPRNPIVRIIINAFTLKMELQCVFVVPEIHPFSVSVLGLRPISSVLEV